MGVLKLLSPVQLWSSSEAVRWHGGSGFQRDRLPGGKMTVQNSPQWPPSSAKTGSCSSVWQESSWALKVQDKANPWTKPFCILLVCKKETSSDTKGHLATNHGSIISISVGRGCHGQWGHRTFSWIFSTVFYILYYLYIICHWSAVASQVPIPACVTPAFPWQTSQGCGLCSSNFSCDFS